LSATSTYSASITPSSFFSPALPAPAASPEAAALVVVAVLAMFHVIPFVPLDWFAALLFFRNHAMLFEYLHHSPLALHWYTGHFWSLSMEEHFYPVLPGLLVVFRGSRL